MKDLQTLSISEDQNSVIHNFFVYDSNYKRNTGYALEKMSRLRACFG